MSNQRLQSDALKRAPEPRRYAGEMMKRRNTDVCIFIKKEANSK